MRPVAWVAVWAALSASPGQAAGAVIRYAIVLGSNVGSTGDPAQPLPPLQHAEREAQALRDRLIGVANFDASARRTILLLGPTREDVRKAAQRVAAQKAEDERAYGRPDSLFAFFFTGHGLSGRLLLRDGPFSAADLAAVFQTVGATFQVGVFDACHSGSIDGRALVPELATKGNLPPWWQGAPTEAPTATARMSSRMWQPFWWDGGTPEDRGNAPATQNRKTLPRWWAGDGEPPPPTKGVRLTPEGNIFRELPAEVVSAEGSIWLTSSGPGEMSYEDHELGGVFTHFFMEGLERAPRDGAGITLESIWNYVRRKTMEHAAEHRRPQARPQLVANLKTTVPLYFSFPVPRTAKLILDEGLEGAVVLEYVDGQLVDTAYKQRGVRQELRVFSGPAQITVLHGDRVALRRVVQLDDGGAVTVRP